MLVLYTFSFQSISPGLHSIFLFCVQENKFFCIGQLMVMTIVNCGSGYPFLAPSVFSYLCGLPIADIVVGTEEVPDYEIRAVIEKVT